MVLLYRVVVSLIETVRVSSCHTQLHTRIITKFPVGNRVHFQFRVLIKCFRFIILVVLLPSFEYEKTQDLQIYHNEFLQGVL